MANDCTFSTYKLVGWALRSFWRRSKHYFLGIWQTMVQPKLDYCLVLWSPADLSISRIKSVCRHFTSSMAAIDYWAWRSQLGIYYQNKPTSVNPPLDEQQWYPWGVSDKSSLSTTWHNMIRNNKSIYNNNNESYNINIKNSNNNNNNNKTTSK